VLATTVFAGVGRADPPIPDGAFVQDAAGAIWLVHGGKRVRVPLYPATADEVAALPASGDWLVPQDGGAGLGARPTWVDAEREGQARPGSGGAASVDGVTVTVLEVSRGWLPAPGLAHPKPGHEYLTLEVHLRNAGGEARRYDFAAFDVDVEGGSRSNAEIGRTPDLLLGTLAPGGTVRGWLTFQVLIGVPAVQLVWYARRDFAVAIPL
jgi:hypothetical protein